MNETASELDCLLAKINATFQTGFENLEIDGRALRLLDISNMASHLDRLVATKAIQQPLRDLPLWAKIWPASFVLGRFLRNFGPEGKTLLEPGCGMGALSLVAAQYGFERILATDICDQALDFARANVLANDLQNTISVKKLDIQHCSAFREQFDMIAAAEILYLEDLHRPILKLLQRSLARDGKAFFCTDMARLKPGFQKLAARHFRITEHRIGVKSDDSRLYSILILEK